MTWDNIKIQQIKQMWWDGLSAQKIADKIGLTKGQVIGKIHREGFEKKPEIIKAQQERISQRKAKKAIAQKKVSKRKKAKINFFDYVGSFPDACKPKPNVPKSEIGITAFGNAKDMIDLNSNECKWPVSEKPYKFCGGEIARGCYCKQHSEIAYKKTLAKIKINGII